MKQYQLRNLNYINKKSIIAYSSKREKNIFYIFVVKNCPRSSAWIEQRFPKPRVGGSSPLGGTNYKRKH